MRNKRIASQAGAASVASPLLQGMMSKTIPTKGNSRREGYPITLNPLGASADSRRFGIDMLEAPVPSRRYAADLCSVRSSHGEMRITFAQQGYDDTEVDSQIIIRMNGTAAANFTDSLAEMGVERDEFVEPALRVRKEDVSQSFPKPGQSANMVANICSVAMAGREACLDFYHASAFAIQKAETESQLEVEPVVRVDIRASLFIAFARKAIEVSGQIKNEEKL